MGAPHVLANPPKVALIGGGFIGPVHAEALRRIGIQVAGLLDISPERARPLAERSGIAKVYDTLDELLARPLDRPRCTSPRPTTSTTSTPSGPSRPASTCSARSPWPSARRRPPSW